MGPRPGLYLSDGLRLGRPLELEVSDKVGQLDAEESDGGGLGYLAGIMSQSNTCPEVSVHQRRSVIKLNRLHQHSHAQLPTPNPAAESEHDESVQTF